MSYGGYGGYGGRGGGRGRGGGSSRGGGRGGYGGYGGYSPPRGRGGYRGGGGDRDRGGYRGGGGDRGRGGYRGGGGDRGRGGYSPPRRGGFGGGGYRGRGGGSPRGRGRGGYGEYQQNFSPPRQQQQRGRGRGGYSGYQQQQRQPQQFGSPQQQQQTKGYQPYPPLQTLNKQPYPPIMPTGIKNDYQQQQQSDAPVHSLFIGNIHQSVKEVELREMFSKFGQVAGVQIKQDETKRAIGHAFVDFINRADAQKAIVELKGTELRERVLRVAWKHHNPTSLRTAAENVIIRGLDKKVSQEMLTDRFKKYGDIISVRVIHRPKIDTGIGFVLYKTKDMADAAVKDADNTDIEGKVVSVESAAKQKESLQSFKKVFVRNLDPEKATNDSFRKFMETCGKVRFVSVKRKNDLVFGVCEYEHHEQAKQSVVKISGQYFPDVTMSGKTLVVNRYISKAELVDMKKGTNVFVKNIDPKIDQDRLRELFKAFGEISSTMIMEDRQSTTGCRLGFVNFTDKFGAERAISGMNGKLIEGFEMKVELSRKKDTLGGGGGRGGFRRRGHNPMEPSFFDPAFSPDMTFDTNSRAFDSI